MFRRLGGVPTGLRGWLRQLHTLRVRQILQSLWTSVGVQAFLFASGILVARSLGPAGRGDIAIVLILPAVASQLVCVGVPSAATYFMARNQAAWRSIARPLPVVCATQAAVAVVLLLVLNHYFLTNKGEATRTAGALVVAAIPLLVAQYYALAILNGLGDLRSWNFYRIAPTAAYAIGLGAALPFGLTIVNCAVVWLGSQAVITSALLRSLYAKYRQAADPDSGTSAIPSRRELIRFGISGFLAQVSPVETFRVDSLMVAALFPSQIIGYYAVALSVSNPPRFVADGIVAVGYAHVASQGVSDGRASTRRYLMAAGVLCGGATLAIAAALPWIIPLIFGQSFAPAVGVSVILVVATGVISVRRVGSDCLRGLGQPGAATVIEVITLVALVPAFVVFGGWGAGRGVALSLGICATLGLALTLLFLRRGPTEES